MNKEQFESEKRLVEIVNNINIERGDWVKCAIFVILAKDFINHFNTLNELNLFLEADPGPFTLISQDLDADNYKFMDFDFGPLTITYSENNGSLNLEDTFQVWDDKNCECIGEDFTYQKIMDLAKKYPYSFMEYLNEKTEEQDI